ncbi:MAG: hypothetical protein EOP09_01865 [Proteobacteria bacterium]|nr:MAG: hypothetical protein EOP09_01865 [Pseudomonadota bacterium]
MTNEQLTLWGFIASIVGLIVSLWTLVIAGSISRHVRGTRFSNRITKIVGNIRTSERAGNLDNLRTDLDLLQAAIEASYYWFQILLIGRVRTLYWAAKAERKAESPNVRLIEGLLQNFRKIHSGMDS